MERGKGEEPSRGSNEKKTMRRTPQNEERAEEKKRGIFSRYSSGRNEKKNTEPPRGKRFAGGGRQSAAIIGGHRNEGWGKNTKGCDGARLLWGQEHLPIRRPGHTCKSKKEKDASGGAVQLLAGPVVQIPATLCSYPGEDKKPRIQIRRDGSERHLLWRIGGCNAFGQEKRQALRKIRGG